MKVAGIIGEYNPFHNGHFYHIANTRKVTGADYVVVALSGDFVQRGEPAIFDKFARTKMALNSGADLVVEIPSWGSLVSANNYGACGVSVLDSLGVVDYLSFGSECGDVKMLQAAARLIAKEPEEFKNVAADNIKKGFNYPKAREMALSQYLDGDVSFLSKPNNILAMEYLCSIERLGSNMEPVSILRQGMDYNADFTGDVSNQPMASAKAVRSFFKENEEKSLEEIFVRLGDNLVPGTKAVLREQYKPLYLNDFSALLKYKLTLEKSQGFTKYQDVSRELSDRIVKMADEFTTVDDFCMKLKTKQYTYTRISRCLMHILLNMTAQADKDRLYDYCENVPYVRILGFAKDASPLVKLINNQAKVPVISKAARVNALLDEKEKRLFNENAYASEVYHLVRGQKYGNEEYNEYKTNLITI